MRNRSGKPEAGHVSPAVWVKRAEAYGAPCQAILFPDGERGIWQDVVNAKGRSAPYLVGPLTLEQLSPVIDELIRQGKFYQSSVPTPARQRAMREGS